VRNVQLTVWLVVACVLAVGCGGDSSTTPTGQYDGRWSGLTGQQMPVSFTVSGSRVTDFRFDYNFDYSGLGLQCATTIIQPSGTSAEISGNTFSFTLTHAGGTVVTTVSGTFSSATQVTGDFSAFTLRNLPCGPETITATYSSPPRDYSSTRN
jgi:hypothetical protein